MTDVTRHLSRGTDHLGSLRDNLRGLIGFESLANELIQNADDAGATSMSFDIRDDSLRVYNDASFTDCGSDNPRCSRTPNCDFHRFRVVASGDKRHTANATGAFGIGFTAVYQVTDQPELISGNRHWILDELAPEEKRIGVCGGCASCNCQESG